MFAIACWLMSFFAPSLALLGHDDWETRERETERCDCVLLAAMLPDMHGDPEVNYRVQRLRTRNCKWLRSGYVERLLIRDCVADWVRLYLATGRSAVARDREIFEWIHSEWHLATAVFVTWPVPRGESEAFLRGHIISGEYERYLEFLDYHLMIAPAPREK